jgi:Flp pilus assembly protein TadB
VTSFFWVTRRFSAIAPCAERQIAWSLAKGGFTVKNPNKAPLVSAIISLFASGFALVLAFCAESLVFSAICGSLIGIFSLELVRRFQAYRLFEAHKEEFAEILAEIERSINGEL